MVLCTVIQLLSPPRSFLFKEEIFYFIYVYMYECVCVWQEGMCVIKGTSGSQRQGIRWS